MKAFHIYPPWDQRLARLLVKPLARTRVTPNQITTLSLVAGLAAAWLLALGGSAANWGAGLFMFAFFIDHADGELARASGKTSRFGHYYDNVAGAAILISVFVGLGFGVSGGVAGQWSVMFGVAAGVAIGIIFGVRLDAGRDESLVMPGFAGFEIEDVLYLIGPIVWLGWAEAFVLLAGIGAPLYLALELWKLRRVNIEELKRG